MGSYSKIYPSGSLFLNVLPLIIQRLQIFFNFPLLFLEVLGFMTNERIANPGPLGLMGFGMTTILLNIHNAGFFPVVSVIMSMGIFMVGSHRLLLEFLSLKKAILLARPHLPLMASFGSH